MILPTKHIPVSSSLIGLGAYLLSMLEQPQAISTLWEKVKTSPQVGSFERFTLALDLLYIINVIELKNNTVRRRKR